ncbi:uncharacterized protein SPAPADRAFT_72003 [Spathaspora passalidarum NRRL Y-27907]|uniref:Zinc finger PHD-type domain-containing protein n=1 Tax=Spathaspora passalidarum (strain NRRL Y-27907 / 11-Y1) TaxID=619300 RepID=G3AP66_SPAPN|nr:uncharacterized protein SPAPADRAFT_72003 [Spathaspora passalidarum NRRL Y-27907]EGW32637.1 hypothetical protein SPAPADRAFT_72003 [Spathaspora passalidarum NRRL Y-27907]
MTNKEEEQLLQDASTLLMFANVAAKQQNQHTIRQVSPPPQASYPQQQQQLQQQQQQQQPQPQPQPVQSQQKQPQQSPMATFSEPVPASAHYPQQPQQQPVRPHIRESPPSQHNQFPLPQYTFPVMYAGPRPPYSLPQPQQSQIAQPPIQILQPQKPPTQDAAVRKHSHPEQTIHDVTPRQPHRSSISILMNTPEPNTEVKQQVPPQTQPQVQTNAPGLSQTEQKQPPQMQPFTHIKSKSQSPMSQVNQNTPAPTSAASRKSVSPPSKLPKQGNFKPTHERSRSTPESNATIKFRHLQVSPTGNKFARGIDLETGERNTTNAVIAAAALTAAADVPLPLKHGDGKRNSSSASSSPILATSKATVVKLEALPSEKKEEDQLTEPEPETEKTDDEKTEDETAAKLSKGSSSSPPAQQKIKDENTVSPATKFQAPPLSTYQVDPDSGLIGCICGIEDDDGFTIQCDVCYRWQHCLCMGFQSADEVPEDEYKCYYCDESTWGKFDPELCRQQTLARLQNERMTSSSQDRSEYSNNNVAPQQTEQNNAPPSNKRRQSGPEKQAEKKKKLDEKKDTAPGTTTAQQAKSPSQPLEQSHEDETLPNKDNELLEDGITAESYQSVYYKLKQNDYKKQSIKEFIEHVGHEFYQGYLSLPKADQQKKVVNNVEIMTFNQFKALKMSKVHLPNHRKYLQEHHKFSKKKNFNKTTIQVKPYSDNQKQKFNGISRLSLFISGSNGGSSPVNGASEAIVIPENTPVIEYLGEIDLFKNYRNDSTNQYTSWGTTKPKVLKTAIPSKDGEVSLVLDSRFVGNESRFIRKSCPSSANCRIQPVYIPEKNTFKFMVLTSKPITLKAESHDEELRLPWEWDVEHPILKLYENNHSEKFENLTNVEKSALITYIDNILNFVECGCSSSNNLSTCAIFKIKKATSYLLRSTRKANSISNVNLMKSKDELILPRPSKEYISWEERLIKRDLELQSKFLGASAELLDQTLVNNIEEQESAVDKPPMLFKIPFKQQLITRIKVSPEELAPEADPDAMKEDQEEHEESNEDIPFPVVPDLVISIDRTIEENLKPIVKEVETKALQPLVDEPDLLDTKSEVEIIQKVVAATVNPVAEPVPEVVVSKKIAELKETVAPTAPKVVKKLSFADYKKKMK